MLRGPQSLNTSMVQIFDPGSVVNTADLLKQGLAFADHLEANHLGNKTDRSIHDLFGSQFSAPDERLTPSAFESTPCPNLDVVEPTPVMEASQNPSSRDLSVPPDGAESWAQLWLQRGFSKLKQYNFEGAVKNFEHALKKDPHCVAALNGLGIAQHQLANPEQAVKTFRQAIQLDPTRAMLYCNLGSSLYHIKDFLNAVSAFQKAARLAPKEVEAYYGLGVALLQQREHNKAIAAFQRAIALNVNHANSYYGLGYTHYRLNDLPAAIAAIGKAKQRDPKYATPYETFLQHCLSQEKP